jgi:hypothetical protein
MEDHYKAVDQLTTTQGALLSATDGFDFFGESFRKGNRLRALARILSGSGFSQILVVDNPVNLGNLAPLIDGRPISKKGIGWFQALLSEECQDLVKGYVILFTNNNLAALGFEGYQHLIRKYPENLFILWDFDNHHWLHCGGRGALLADIYVPAHYDNIFLLSRFNSFCLEPTNCGVLQWTSDFLSQHLSYILEKKRSNEPLGHHTAWNFPYRLKVLQTFSLRLPKVGVCSPTFNQLSPIERLDEWCGHKSHIVIPVYNDLPIRIFDALITGGIPIIPRTLQAWARIGGIEEEEAVYYDAMDIVEPSTVVGRANLIFDTSGQFGMVKRIAKAHSLFHGDARVRSIVARSLRLLSSLGN